MEDKIQRILQELEAKKKRISKTADMAEQEAKQAEYRDEEEYAYDVVYKCGIMIETIDCVIKVIQQINKE